MIIWKISIKLLLSLICNFCRFKVNSIMIFETWEGNISTLNNSCKPRNYCTKFKWKNQKPLKILEVFIQTRFGIDQYISLHVEGKHDIWEIYKHCIQQYFVISPACYDKSDRREYYITTRKWIDLFSKFSKVKGQFTMTILFLLSEEKQ